MRDRLATLGVLIEPPERRTTEHYRRTLPRELEKAVAIIRTGGLSAD